MRLFFSTELAPCPYLAERLERRLVTVLDSPDPDALHDRLMAAGFRRSQALAYRPACPGCSACVPVRIPVERFRLSRGWRRIWRQNADLVAADDYAVGERDLRPFRTEAPPCQFVGRRDAVRIVHSRQHLELRDIEVFRRADTGQNRLGRARCPVNVEAELNHPLDHQLYMFLSCVVLHRYDHCFCRYSPL